jgi:hypothetical protein
MIRLNFGNWNTHTFFFNLNCLKRVPFHASSTLATVNQIKESQDCRFLTTFWRFFWTKKFFPWDFPHKFRFFCTLRSSCLIGGFCPWLGVFFSKDLMFFLKKNIFIFFCWFYFFFLEISWRVLVVRYIFAGKWLHKKIWKK